MVPAVQLTILAGHGLFDVGFIVVLGCIWLYPHAVTCVPKGKSQEITEYYIHEW